mgnify:CR=1 FL=1
MNWGIAVFIVIVAFCCFWCGVFIGINKNRVCLNDDNKECKSYFVDVSGKTKVAYVINTKQINTFTYGVVFSELYSKEKIDSSSFWNYGIYKEQNNANKGTEDWKVEEGNRLFQKNDRYLHKQLWFFKR